MKKQTKKGRTTQIVEYSLAYAVFSISNVLPWKALHSISSLLGRLLFILSSKRRNLALNNVRNALDIKDERKVRNIALRSFTNFFLTFLEIPKIRTIMTGHDSIDRMSQVIDDVDSLFSKAKRIHDESGGCIFVTPHLGNWEILPYIGSVMSVPLTVVIRPLDNPYIERLLNREASGQIITPKKDALSLLKRTLKVGGSVGMLPDQSTMKGLMVDFFGRKATTTPVPAILAMSCRRPIVTVSCCRADEPGDYEVFISDPIWPKEAGDKRAEIIRLTEEMTRSMEDVIRRYPEQYLWMHNRWKRYRGKREFLGEKV